jgi:hypothetical protein
MKREYTFRFPGGILILFCIITLFFPCIGDLSISAGDTSETGADKSISATGQPHVTQLNEIARKLTTDTGISSCNFDISLNMDILEERAGVDPSATGGNRNGYRSLEAAVKGWRKPGKLYLEVSGDTGTYVFCDNFKEICFHSVGDSIFWKMQKGNKGHRDSFSLSHLWILFGKEWCGIEELIQSLKWLFHPSSSPGPAQTHVTSAGDTLTKISLISPDIYGGEGHSTGNSPAPDSGKDSYLLPHESRRIHRIDILMKPNLMYPVKLRCVNRKGRAVSTIDIILSPGDGTVKVEIRGAPDNTAFRCSITCAMDRDSRIEHLKCLLHLSERLSLKIEAGIEWDREFHYYNFHHRIPPGTRRLDALHFFSFLSDRITDLGISK